MKPSQPKKPAASSQQPAASGQRPAARKPTAGGPEAAPVQELLALSPPPVRETAPALPSPARPASPAVIDESTPAAAEKKKTIRDREAWMRRFVQGCRPWFEEAGYPLPPAIRLTMSLTKGKRVVATCYSRAASEDGTNEILVRLDQAAPLDIADSIVHELCHAVDDCQHGHLKPFKLIARRIGLVGPLKSCGCGPEARERCEKIIAALGPFPHAALNVTTGKRSGPSTQKNRHVKAVCTVPQDGEPCGYACRLSRAWIDRGGPPICPIHGESMTVEGDEDDGEDGGDE